MRIPTASALLTAAAMSFTALPALGEDPCTSMTLWPSWIDPVTWFEGHVCSGVPETMKEEPSAPQHVSSFQLRNASSVSRPLSRRFLEQGSNNDTVPMTRRMEQQTSPASEPQGEMPTTWPDWISRPFWF